MNPQQYDGQMPPSDPNNPPPQSYAGQPPIQPGQSYSPTVQPALPQQPGRQSDAATGSYDFIVNPQKPGKKSFSLLASDSSTLRRAGIAGAGLAILLIIVILFASLLGGNGNNATPLITVAQEQTELARVASLGAQKASGQSTQNLANNVSLSLISANAQLLNYMAINHHKLSPKILSLKHSSQTDHSLEAALADSTFDSTFTDIIQADLNSYIQSLKAAYKANPGPKGRQLLSNQYNGAQLLLTQSYQ